eukprot:6460333-Amphidinium_carterae.1
MFFEVIGFSFLFCSLSIDKPAKLVHLMRGKETLTHFEVLSGVEPQNSDYSSDALSALVPVFRLCFMVNLAVCLGGAAHMALVFTNEGSDAGRRVFFQKGRNHGTKPPS